MLKGRYIVDSLCKVWLRGYVEIDEEDKIETVEDLIRAIESGNIQLDPNEIIYDTMEDVLLDENKGYSTIEIYQDSTDTNPIYENGQPNFIPDTSK